MTRFTNLIVVVRSDFDPRIDKLILELLLAHEWGHWAYFAAGRVQGTEHAEEVIADFFMAKWAARRGAERGEREAALNKILDGSSGHSSATLHISDPAARRDLILWYYNNISQNPEFWLNLPNTENTFRNYVEPLYTD